jgi:hypothetical protein
MVLGLEAYYFLESNKDVIQGRVRKYYKRRKTWMLEKDSEQINALVDEALGWKNVARK